MLANVGSALGSRLGFTIPVYDNRYRETFQIVFDPNRSILYGIRMELPPDISPSLADTLPAGVYPELPPPADYAIQLLPRAYFKVTNRVVLGLGVELSRAGVDISGVLSSNQLRSYITIAEHPDAGNEELGRRREIAPQSVPRIKSRLVNRLYEACAQRRTAELNPDHVTPELTRPPTRTEAAGHAFVVVYEHGTKVDAVRAMHQVLIDNGIDPRTVLPSKAIETYMQIVDSDKQAADLVTQMEVKGITNVSKACTRILARLSPYVPRSATLPPILARPAPERPLDL